MKTKLINWNCVLAARLGIVSLLLVGGPSAWAADRTWAGGSGTDDFWNSAGNWDVTPVSGDNVIFATGNRTFNTNDIVGLNLGWLRFDIGDFTVGGNAITLAAGMTNTSGANTLTLPLTLSAAQSFASASGGTLSVSNTLSVGANALTMAGDGDVVLAGVVSGTGSLVKNDAGTLTFAALNTYSGGLTANAGTINARSANSTGSGCVGTSNLVVNSGATVNALVDNSVFGNGATLAPPRSVTINAGGLVTTVDRSGHVSALILNGGTLSATTPRSDYGNWNLDYGVSTLTNGSTSSIEGGNVTLGQTGGTVFNIGAGDTVNVSSVIAHTASATDLGLIKSGAGLLALAEANTYTSATIINAGTLALTGPGSIARTPTITLGTNGTFDVSATSFTLNTNQALVGVGRVVGTVIDNDAGAIGSVISPGGAVAGTLAMDGLTFNGNALVLNFNLASVTTVGGGVNDLITCTNLSLSTGNTNIVNFTFSGTPSASPYTLITYPLGQGPAAGPVTTLAAAASRSTYTFTSDGTSIKVTVVPNAAPLVWRGDGATNNWDLNTSANFMNGVNKDVFLTGDNATFNDTGSNTPPVNLVGALPANIVTVAGTKDYTFAGSGKLSSSSRLNKTSSGTLTILTANDNTGGGLLSGGSVNVGNGGNPGGLGSGLLTNNTKVSFNQSLSSTYAGNMSGTGSVTTFIPGATLSLTGTNTFTGGLTHLNGTLYLGSSTPTAGSSTAGNITNYGSLYISRTDAFTNQNFITSDGNLNQFGYGDINIRGAGGMTVDGTASLSSGNNGNFSVSQSLVGKMTVNAGGLVNVGAILLLGNPGNFKGDVIQNGGTINVVNHVRIGHWGNDLNTQCTYVMNGGTLNVPNGQVAVGWDGIGIMNMIGGTVNCVRLTVDDNGITGSVNGTNSTFYMTGGLLNLGTGGLTSVSTTNQVVPTVQLGGGTISAVAPAGFTSSLHMWFTNGTPTFSNNNNNVTLTGVLKGNGGLTKAGTGVLQLDATNIYSGTTTVAGGRLQGGGVISGPVIVQTNAVLSAGGTYARGTLTVSNNVTVNQGASLVLDQASTAASTDLIKVVGNLTLDAATPLYLNFTGGLPYTGGTNIIVTNTGTRVGSLVYVNPTRYAMTLDQSNPNFISTGFTGTNANLVWKGNIDNQWNVNNTLNWLNGASADRYYQSDAVILDNTGIAQPNITLASTINPASVTVNAAGNYKLAGGDVVSLGTLTKNGSGTLTLDNYNWFTSGAFVNAGTLQIGNGGSTGYFSNNIVNNATVTFNHSTESTYYSTMSGSGTLTVSGPGKLILVANQSHFGGSLINAGSTVQIGNGLLANSGSLGNGTATNNGALIFYETALSVATALSGSGSLTFLGTGIAAQSSYPLNATNTFTGPVVLSLSRIQSGYGALSFGNPSSITVNPLSQVYAVSQPFSSVFNLPLTLAGTGWQDGLGALRMEPNVVGNPGVTWAGPITLANNARIGVNTASTNTITGTITGAAYELETYGGNATAALILAPSTPNTFASLRVSIGTAGAKTIAGNANALPNNIPLYMNGGTLQLNGFSKSFGPYLNLNASSSIQNGSTNALTTVTLAPVLGISTNSGTFADGASQPLNVTFSQTPGLWTLALTGASANWTGNLTNNGGIITVGGTTGSAYLGANAGNTLGRNIVGNNGAVFFNSINNTLNGYAGNVVLNNSSWICNRYISMAANAGYLYLANATMTGTNSSDGNYESWLLPSTVLVRGNGPSYMLGTGTSAAFDLQSSGTTFDVADVTGNANSDLIVGGGSSTTFLHAPANATTGGSLIKTGAGTLELNGLNSYTGSTVISNGVIKLGAAATLPTSSITVASGATLDASALGTLTLSATGETLKGGGTVLGIVSDGATSVIAPGSGGAGTLTVGGLVLNGSGGTLAIELNSTTTTVGSGVNDLIQVNGDLSLNDSAPTLVNFAFLNGPPAAGTYTILKWTGNVTGTAAGLTNTFNGTFTVDTSAKEVRVTFVAPPAQSLVWQGDGGGNSWDVSTSSINWSNAAALMLTNFFQFDAVRFDDTSANTTVDIPVTVTPASITFDSVNNYTLQGAGQISGNLTITKQNVNTVIMNAKNTAVGPINVNAGTYALGKNDTYVGATVVTVSNGAAFDFAGYNDNTLGLAHTFVIAGSGPDGQGALRNENLNIVSYANVSNLTLTANSVIGSGGTTRWDIGPFTNGTVNGQGYSLTKVGNGTLDMRAQFITNVASITVSNGYMFYENYQQTNAWTATTTNYIKPGASLGNYGGLMIGLPLVLDGAVVKNEGNGTPNWAGPIRVDSSSVFSNNAAQIVSGIISGPGGITLDGGVAAVTVSNANSYAGGTIIGNAPATIIGAGTSGTAALIVANASALGSGPLTISGSSYSSLSTNAAYFGTNILRPVEFNLTGGIVPNAINLPTTIITNVALQGRDGSSAVTLSGKISGGHTALTNWFDNGVGNVGVIRLSNPANDFVAGRIIVNRGTLALTTDALGNLGNTLAPAASSTVRIDAAAVTLAHPINAVNNPVYFDLFGDNNGDGVPETVNNATISGLISGAGTIYPRGTNSVLTLTGLNTFSGGFELQQPLTLSVAASTNLGTAYVAIKYGSTFRYTGTGSETMTRILWMDNNVGGTIDIPSASASLTWNPSGGTLNQPLAKTGAGTLTYGTQVISGGSLSVNGGAMTVNSAISGATWLTVNNGSTLTLNGANTHVFPTVVNSGKLFVNGTIPAGSPVSISGAGASILGGSGTINSVVTVNAGASLQPGVNAIGKLTINNTLNLAGSTVMEVNGDGVRTNDAVTGLVTLNYGGSLVVNNLGSQNSLTNGVKFSLFSALLLQGTFSSITLPPLNSGLGWSTNLWLDGSIQVVATVNTSRTNLTTAVVGNQLILSWPADHTGWKLQAQTNSVNAGLNPAGWVTIPNTELSNSYTNTIDPVAPTVFYRMVY